ncbi:MAG TPA: transglutaminase family protein [Pirellulales bacterium]|nr:transglutaminase family protein [Pirellulales bacterium]
MADSQWPSVRQLLAMNDAELARQDIAAVDLACAAGLPGAEDLDIPRCLAKLDEWTDLVASGTECSLHRRAKEHSYREFSDAQFRILVMITVLQRNLGVRYNLAFSQGKYDASDSNNLMLHGLLTGHGGTCVTMPVLYAAIGRRLGYPIKLALAKEHTFCRWDDQHGERFNIEATSPGFNSTTDDYYLMWPKSLTSQEIASGRWLVSLSSREELAFFLGERGSCCVDNLMTLQAVEACYHSHKLAPHDPVYEYRWGVAIMLHRAVKEMERQGQLTPFSNTLLMPAPKEPWEKCFYPHA